MLYRVILEVGYREAWFDFKDMTEAVVFANQIIEHMTDNKESEKPNKIHIEVIQILEEKESESHDVQ